MKKLLLTLALLLAAISGDALARHCRRRCSPCPTRCAPVCKPKCRLAEKCVSACAKKAECEKCACPEDRCTVKYITVPAMVPRVVWEEAECAHEVKEVCKTSVSQACVSGIQPRGTAAAKYGAENVQEFSDDEYRTFAEENGCF